MRKIMVAYPVLFLLAAVGAAHANTWSTGQEITYTESEWNGGMSGTPASTLLNTYFNTVYGGSFDTLTVGWSGGYTLVFESASDVEAYLPASGAIDPLDATLLDPTSSASGSFGGDVLALTLDVDFSNLTGSSGPAFGNLVIEGIPARLPQFPALSAVDGLTVGQFLAQLDVLLGGGSSTYGTIAELDPIAIAIDVSFIDGTPDTFAQEALVPPPTTAVPTPEPGSSGLMLIGVALLGLATVVRKRNSRGQQMAS